MESRGVKLLSPKKERKIIEAAYYVRDKWLRVDPTNDNYKQISKSLDFKGEVLPVLEYYLKEYPNENKQLLDETNDVCPSLKALKSPYSNPLAWDRLNTATRREIEKLVKAEHKEFGYVFVPKITSKTRYQAKDVVNCCLNNCIRFSTKEDLAGYVCECAKCHTESVVIYTRSGEPFLVPKCDCGCSERIVVKATYGDPATEDSVLNTSKTARTLYQSGISEDILDMVLEGLGTDYKVFERYYLENNVLRQDFRKSILEKEISVNGNTYVGIPDTGTGNGEVRYSNGDIYTGTLAEHQRNGNGRLEQGNTVQEGYFKNDRLANGTVTISGLTITSSCWNPDLSADNAHVETSDWTYDGSISFSNGEIVKNGHGKLVAADYEFEGVFTDNRPNGQGTYRFKNGPYTSATSMQWTDHLTSEKVNARGPERTFSGKWESGNIIGLARLEISGEYVYHGMFDNNEICGGGTYHFKDRMVSSEKWSSDGNTDNAVIRYSDGTIYAGPLTDMMRSGRNCEYGKPGKFTYTGSFEDDHICGEGTYVYDPPGQDGMTEARSTCWTDDLVSDKARIRYSNGDEYRGGFKKAPFGKGVRITADTGNTVYSKCWDVGPKGTCIVTDRSEGTVVICPLLNGDAEGDGRLIKKGALGFTYTGPFSRGHMHGIGILTQDGKSTPCTWRYGALIAGTMKTRWKDGTYSGKWADSKPDGDGELVRDNQDMYQGSFRQGCYHGKGLLTNPDGTVLDGYWTYGVFAHNRKQWVNNELVNVDCRGRLPNGDWFCGIWANGRPVHGRLEITDGSVYEGAIKDGLPNGKGKMTWPWTVSGENTWEGQWIEGRLVDGSGIALVDGDWYSGSIILGLKDGPGALYRKDGISVHGTFEDDRLVSVDRLQYPDGSYYSGECKGLKKNGHGTYCCEDGKVVYEGTFEDDLLNGKAVKRVLRDDGTWKTVYEGEWSEGARNGYGFSSNDDGTSYVGYWKNDLYHGNGTLYVSGFHCSRAGTWNSGKLVSHRYTKDDSEPRPKYLCIPAYYDERVEVPWEWPLYSALVPGLGQFMRGYRLLGIAMFAITVLLLAECIVNYGNWYTGFYYLAGAVVVFAISTVECYIYNIIMKFLSKKVQC